MIKILSATKNRISVLRFAALCCMLMQMSSVALFAQPGMWTWISGSNTPGAAAVFGTQGVPSVNNHPAFGYEQLQWKDQQGNFWLYGSGWTPFSDDMWKYDPVTLEWTWMRGSGGVYAVAPVRGVMGVSDPANYPGQRSLGAGTWTDQAGNFWLFGGGVAGPGGYASDLWKYDIGTNEWTWMKGPAAQSNGVHGILGVPNAANDPGGRLEAYANWTDNNNNLWLFGGYGYDDAGTLGTMNDLMKYSIATNEWTWMKGSNISGVPVNYGTLGVSSPTNDPGRRWACSNLKDLQGNFWLFGGATGGTNGGYRNDMWKYDPLVNEWTWMAGPNNTQDPGIYQTTCTFNNTGRPAARCENRASVADHCGNFWFYGGYTIPAYVNDLWVFNPVTLQWNWLDGTPGINVPGSWGTLGVASASNTPGGRDSGIAWWGNDNRFYTFGGPDASAGYADLWVYDPDSCVMLACLPPVAMFTASNHICPGDCIDFVNLSSFASSFQWTFNGSSTATSTDQNPSNICYPAPGTYSVTLIAQNLNGSDTLTLNNFITVYPFPQPQGIAQNGDTLFANPGAAGYQWYLNGNIIPGATGYYYVATQSGDYNVVATDANGCEVEAVINSVIAELQSSPFSPLFSVYPNPAEQKLSIRSLQSGTMTSEIKVRNMLGETMLIQFSDNQKEIVLDTSVLPAGLYLLDISSDGKIFRSRFVKS